jgi:hypothetical protein
MLISDLIAAYTTDPASAYGALRYGTRNSYDSRLRIIGTDLGTKEIAALRTRDILLAYQSWLLRGTTMAHGLVGMLRTLAGYGGTMLECDDCLTLAGKMRLMRFKMGTARSVRITAPQVIAIRRTAHAMGLHSLALAQTLQFGLMLRQKDVIGEWLPIAEPGESDVHHDGKKWLRGVRWDDPAFGIEWPMAPTVMSDKDKSWPDFKA